MQAIKSYFMNPMLKNFGFSIAIIVAFISSFGSLQASHIVGGQLTYRYLGNHYYEIKLIVRRDCINGADTVPFDNPAIIGVFYRDNQKAFRVGNDGTFRLKQTNDDTLHQRVDNVCLGPHEEVCVHQSTYIDTFLIPQDDRGYFLVYQRCCRNFTITNIEEPDETGTTFVCEIKPLLQGVVNSTPQWGDFPPIYACANQELVFDHSAIDPDGDSLVYSFCTPYLGKTKQFPADRPDNPPYTELSWKQNYGLTNLFGPGTPYSLDTKTGLFKVTPAHPAQYLVGLCVKEYRNGQLLSEIRRDFELNVVLCGITPVAKFSRSSDPCDGLEVRFQNQSVNSTNYKWYFNYDQDTSHQSNLANPVFRYAKEGNYRVLLIVQNGSCLDSTFQLIKVLDPQLVPRFSYSLNCTDSLVLTLANQTTSRYRIVKTEWCIFGPKDSLRSNLNNPSLKLPREGFFEITLKIEDENGCKADTLIAINPRIIPIDLYTQDTTICLGDSVKLLRNPSNRFTYQWTPTTGLNFSDPINPWAKPTQTTKYTVSVSDSICTAEKMVTVQVKPVIAIQLIGDTISCDGNVKLISITQPAHRVRWSNDPSFMPVLSTDSIFITRITKNTRFYLTAGDKGFCVDTPSILIQLKAIDLQYPKEKRICTEDTVSIFLQNNNPGDSVKISWNANPIIIGNLTSPNIQVVLLSVGRYVLYFTAVNRFGCSLTDSIVVSGFYHPTPSIEATNDCGSLTVHFRTNAFGKITWTFGDGIGQSTQASPSYTYSKSGTYRVKLSSDSICIRDTFIDITVVELSLNLKDSLSACIGDSVILNPGGNASYTYHWTPSDGLSDPFSASPKLLVTSSRWIYVTVKDPILGDSCVYMDSIWISAVLHKTPDITSENDCGSLEVFFKTSALGKLMWDLGDGVGRSTEKQFRYKYPKPGKYKVSLSSDSTCVRDTFIEIVVVELKITLEDTIISCFGQSVPLNPGGDPKLSYMWSPTQGLNDAKIPNPIATVSSSQWYYVTVTDQDFPDYCMLKDSVFVFVPPVIESLAGQDTLLCKKSVLTFEGKSNLQPVNFSWCDENNQMLSDTSTLKIEVDHNRYFILKTSDKYHCTDMDTVFVKFYNINGQINGPDIICIGDTVMLMANISPDGPYQYAWKPGNFVIGSDSNLTVKIYTDKSQMFQLMVMHDSGCVWNLTHNIQVNNPQLGLSVDANPKIIVAGQKSQLTATYNPNWKYKWSPDDGSLNDINIHNPIAMPFKTTTYTVQVIDEAGCIAYDTISVIVQTCFDAIFIPNAFSPNGDRYNDQLCVRTRPGTLEKIEWMIFNRWGEKVFESKDINTCWDGVYKDKILPPDVFGYIIKFNCPGQEEQTKKGNVTILK